MAPAHQHRAQHHGVAPSDQLVRDQSAEHRRQIDEAGVEPEHLRGERQRAHLAEHAFEPGAERGEAGDMFDMAGQEKLLAHIEHEQARHAVIGKTLPRLGEGEKAERARLAEERAARGGTCDVSHDQMCVGIQCVSRDSEIASSADRPKMQISVPTTPTKRNSDGPALIERPMAWLRRTRTKAAAKIGTRPAHCPLISVSRSRNRNSGAFSARLPCMRMRRSKGSLPPSPSPALYL